MNALRGNSVLRLTIGKCVDNINANILHITYMHERLNTYTHIYTHTHLHIYIPYANLKVVTVHPVIGTVLVVNE
jgi:hypothetical protein